MVPKDFCFVADYKFKGANSEFENGELNIVNWNSWLI